MKICINKNLGNYSGNVIAVIKETKKEQWLINHCYEAITAVFECKNSDCCFGQVSPEYLTERCKRISEKQAKEIHPNLFYYIEN